MYSVTHYFLSHYITHVEHIHFFQVTASTLVGNDHQLPIPSVQLAFRVCENMHAHQESLVPPN